jgi:GntR family transcriptional regulator/MocR family aminotransferase
MLTLTFEDNRKTPLYEQLYHRIRSDIESRELQALDKLPSKRKLAEHLRISQFTVENAYSQLLAEGYISSVPRKGYFVCDIPVTVGADTYGSLTNDLLGVSRTAPRTPFSPQDPSPAYDLKTNAVDTEHFPWSVWSRLMRECMRENSSLLLSAIHPQGDEGLRKEITRYLRTFRGVNVSPEQIVLGAGTEYLIGLITELLSDTSFALENPGYRKAMRILYSRRMDWYPVPVDDDGIRVDSLKQTAASTVFVTPSNHFPTGAVMGIGRRAQLLQWALEKEGRYIIEDDFDSEFRFVLKPIPSLHSLDKSKKVIYMNSFAKTLAPSLRIAYIVLPELLLDRYHERLMFYSCTVSQFEQLTLKLFLQRGYYERHLNRMKTIYKSRKNAFLEGLADVRDKLSIGGEEAGLHLLLKVFGSPERYLVDFARAKGVGVYPLSDYFMDSSPETHTVVVGCAGLPAEELRHAAELLCEAWK